MSVSPSDDQLKAALTNIKNENSSLGIPKIHALLRQEYPDWIVSEKRTRKVLQTAGLVQSTYSNVVYPSSRIIPIDVTKWTSKVEVHYFGNSKGKGLRATEHIAANELIWKEDPFAIGPEWDIFKLQINSLACAHCTTILNIDSPLVLPCPSACGSRFCNRLCLSRSHHGLLCPIQNPASIPLMSMIKETQWMALNAWAQVTSRLLTTLTFDPDLQAVLGFAELTMEQRFKKTSPFGEPDRTAWMKAHQFYIQAFQEPTTATHKKKLDRLIKTRPSIDVQNELFQYDGFSRGLGKMGLNMEGHGGLYVLHSHLNHSCERNVSVRHLEQRTALARINVIATRDIAPGEELLISYVSPEQDVKTRERELEAWGFGKCQCPRCFEERKSPKYIANSDMDDLEKELKAGLGVM